MKGVISRVWYFSFAEVFIVMNIKILKLLLKHTNHSFSIFVTNVKFSHQFQVHWFLVGLKMQTERNQSVLPMSLEHGYT